MTQELKGVMRNTLTLEKGIFSVDPVFTQRKDGFERFPFRTPRNDPYVYRQSDIPEPAFRDE